MLRMIHKIIRERDQMNHWKKIINNLYKFIMFINKKNILYFKQFLFEHILCDGFNDFYCFYLSPCLDI